MAEEPGARHTLSVGVVGVPPGGHTAEVEEEEVATAEGTIRPEEGEAASVAGGTEGEAEEGAGGKKRKEGGPKIFMYLLDTNLRSISFSLPVPPMRVSVLHTNASRSAVMLVGEVVWQI